MSDKKTIDTSKYTTAHKRRNHWLRLMSVLACVVVFCTTYALILPAITQTAPVYCGFEEEHTDECRQEGTVLTCTLLPEGHSHCEECFGTQALLLCALEESEPHQHTEQCCQEQTLLLCTLAEDPGHTHEESCWGEPVVSCGLEESEEHSHTDACLSRSLICGQEERAGHSHDAGCYVTDTVLICDLEETEGHTHTDECRSTEQILLCGLEESEPHTHTDACYTTGPVLVCGKELHTHSLQCFSDPEADAESIEEWNRMFERLELTGDLPADLLTVATSQLGYTESSRNYLVLEDGEHLRGYTRYGHWLGDPYMEWDTAFCCFCLHYAGASPEVVPSAVNAEIWLGVLPLWGTEVTEAPAAGDLVFFDWDTFEDPAERKADAVGILARTEEAGVACYKVILGDSSDKVEMVTFEPTDPRILTIARLGAPAPKTYSEQSLTLESGLSVRLNADDDNLPVPMEEITLTAGLFGEDEEAEFTEEDLLVMDTVSAWIETECTEMPELLLLNLSLLYQGEAIEPTGPVTVTLDPTALMTADRVFYVDTVNGAMVDMNAVTSPDGSICFTTDHFSVYALVGVPQLPDPGISLLSLTGPNDLRLLAVWAPVVATGVNSVDTVVKSTDSTGATVYLAGSGGQYSFVSDPADATVFTLSADNGWALQLSNAPTGHLYTLEQTTSVPDYKPTYSSGSYCLNSASMDVSFTPSADIENQYLQLRYFVNGQPGVYTTESPMTLTGGQEAEPVSFSIPGDYPDGTTFSVQSIYVAKQVGDSFVRDPDWSVDFSFRWTAHLETDPDTQAQTLLVTNTSTYQLVDDPDTEIGDNMNLDKTVRQYTDPKTGNPVENEFVVTLRLDMVSTTTQYLEKADYKMQAQNNVNKSLIGTLYGSTPESKEKEYTTDPKIASDNGWLDRWVKISIYDFVRNPDGTEAKDPQGNRLKGELLAKDVTYYFENANNTTIFLHIPSSTTACGKKHPDCSFLILGAQLNEHDYNDAVLTAAASEVLHNVIDSKSLSVQDWMGPGVEYIGKGAYEGDPRYENDEVILNEDNSFTWKPYAHMDQIYETMTSQNTSVTRYKDYAILEYRVRLVTEAEDFNSCGGNWNSAVTDNVSYMVNEKATADYGGETHDFPVPYVRGVLYNLKIKKIDSQTQDPIPGAQFEIRTNEGMEDAITDHKVDGKYIVTTGEDGTAKFLDLVGEGYGFDGVFYIDEIAPADGYYQPDNPVATVSIGNYTNPDTRDNFVVDDDKNMLYTDPQEVLSILNEPLQRLSIIKADMVDMDPLAGAEYDLYYEDETEPQLHLISNEEGILQAEDPEDPGKPKDPNATDLAFDLGKWTLKETKAPNGYLLPTGDITITVLRDKITVSGNMKLYDPDDAPEILYLFNASGFELPNTGGIGTTAILLTGILLILFSAIVPLGRSRYRRERRAGR